jgi:hypothetical protein
MEKRHVNPALMEQLLAGTVNQEIKKSYDTTNDPNFPFYKIPRDESGNPLDNIVYFPRSVVSMVDGEEVYDPLTLYAHRCRQGKGYPTYRCTASLVGGLYESEFGYDGECPFCAATAQCWDLYNKKLAITAKERNIDLDNDTTDAMKSVRSDLLAEMAIKNPDEMVVFPIVVISNTGYIPTSRDKAVIKPYFHVMRMQTFKENILDQLTKLPVPIKHPGGLFFSFQYSYDTKGKPANLRDAGKNAKYIPLLDMNSTNALAAYVAEAEEAAKDFTRVKAGMVYVPGEFYTKDEQTKIVDKLMASTRSVLASMSVMENGGGNAQLTGNNGVAGALASFGATPANGTASVAGALAAFGATPATAAPAGDTLGITPAPAAAAPTAAPAPAAESVAPTFGAAPTQPASNGAATFGGFGGAVNS